MKPKNLLVRLSLLAILAFTAGTSNPTYAESTDPYKLSIDNVVNIHIHPKSWVVSGVMLPENPRENVAPASNLSPVKNLGNVTLNFEGIGDLHSVGNFYENLGVIFSGFLIFEEGKSLNPDADAPSGIAVALISGRSGTVTFDPPVRSVSFTFGTMEALGAVALDKEGSSIDTFSYPHRTFPQINQRASLASDKGIAKLIVTGQIERDIVIDDLTFEPLIEVDYIKVFPNPAYVLVEKGLQFIAKGYRFGENNVRDGDPCPRTYAPAGDDIGPIDIEVIWTTSLPPGVGSIDKNTGLFQAGKEVGKGVVTATYGGLTDTAEVFIIGVESITASSDVADNSPQVFEGHKTNFGDPCSPSNLGQALIIFYDAVVDKNFQVQDFDVNLKATVLPPSVTHNQLNESWAKTEGPHSGNLNRTDTFKVKYQNPKVGGLYTFEFDLGLGCPNSGANLLLPLAGADMTSWLRTEAASIGAWARSHKKATEEANYHPITWVTYYKVYDTWMTISPAFFDYVFDPVDLEQRAPCRRFQPTIGLFGQYGYITVNGVVVHGSKINNMLWALFGRYWGWNEILLKLGAHATELWKRYQIDPPTSQRAIGFGADIYTLLQNDPSADITSVLTQSNLQTLREEDALIEEMLWPSPYSADAGNSTFTRPTLPTTPYPY